MTNGDLFIIFFLGLTALIVITCLIAWAIAEIQSKIEKKKREKLIQDYPELMPLLEEYMRTCNNVAYTVKEQYKLKEEINKQVEKNKYLPKVDRVDAYIETLKEKYKWLDDLREEQYVEKQLAYKKLELFWATNFPKLKEEKRIMWWYW
jgi:DNA phosphorothioation-dependent restriction protein DptG